MIDLKLLIKNGVHFGHQTSRWSPKMEPYIWGFRNGIHLIDVMKTAIQLEKAAKFLEDTAAEGRTILLVGTKKAAQESIRKAATDLEIPFVVHRWVGGTFTNYRQVRKAIANLMTFEETLDKSGESHYTKKELNLLKKRAGRLDNIVGGIRNLSWPVGAVVVVDVKKENVVVKEARASGIPIVGIVDTNCDPTGIDHVVPGNDDSPRSIACLVEYLTEAIARGQKLSAKKPKKELEIIETLVETLYDDETAETDIAGKAKKRPIKAKVRIDELEAEVSSKAAPLVIERSEALGKESALSTKQPHAGKKVEIDGHKPVAEEAVEAEESSDEKTSEKAIKETADKVTPPKKTSSKPTKK